MLDLLSDNQRLLLFALVIPLIAALGAFLIKRSNVRDAFVVIFSLVMFGVTAKFVNNFISSQQEISLKLFEIVPGISLAFEVEYLGVIFSIIVSMLWFFSTLYSIGYMRGNKEKNQNRFYGFFAISIFAATGIAYSANLFTLFIFYELLTLCTYPLVTHAGNEKAKLGGRTYISLLMGTSILFLLPAIIITYNVAGTLEFRAGGIIANQASPLMMGLLLALYMFGIGKAALMPLHRWLPAAMVAPTPVSALLHAVAVVKAGAFSVIKIVVYIFGYKNLSIAVEQNWWSGGWLVYVAGFTIIMGSIVAMRQDNLKRRLAYSTVSQLSYIVMAVAILSPKSIIAAAFHIAAHAFGKITLFFVAGSIYTVSKKSNVSQLDGIGKKMPYTMTAFGVATLCMIGIPPSVGFISKWYMMVGAFDREMIFAVIVLIISTVLNASYFLPIVYQAFFKEEKYTSEQAKEQGILIKHKEAPKLMVIAILATSIATLVLFFRPDIFLDLAKNLVR